MTIRRPEDVSLARWLTSGLNVKTVVLMTAAVVGSYYMQGTRITVVEQQEPELSKRLDYQRDLLTHKVDKDDYAKDQVHIEAELAAIRASQDRIETILMERADRGAR